MGIAKEACDDVWDAATNAVCQTMQEEKMCNCPDGDCLAAKVKPEHADYMRFNDLALASIEMREEMVKALREIATDAEEAQRYYDRYGPTWTTPAGSEYEDTSAHLAKCNSLAEALRALLTRIGEGT